MYIMYVYDNVGYSWKLHGRDMGDSLEIYSNIQNLQCVLMYKVYQNAVMKTGHLPTQIDQNGRPPAAN